MGGRKLRLQLIRAKPNTGNSPRSYAKQTVCIAHFSPMSRVFPSALKYSLRCCFFFFSGRIQQALCCIKMYVLADPITSVHVAGLESEGHWCMSPCSGCTPAGRMLALSCCSHPVLSTFPSNSIASRGLCVASCPQRGALL